MAKKRKTGFYWHVHHDELFEWCYDYDERRDYIEKHKPTKEIATRLRLFQPIKGQLPRAMEKAGAACDKAWDACGKAKDARDKAWDACETKIFALHAKECSNCPWDGKQIVFDTAK